MLSLSPPPPQNRLPEQEILPAYSHWRWRHLYATFFGYAVFYFVRQNIPAALPLMERDLHYGKADLGKFLSIHSIVYGVSKFLNGILGDRSNPRLFMALGLFLSAMANLCFGFSTSLVVLGSWWVVNGWVQGMGFPPCARLLAHWFAARERGRKWALWNMSHQVGGAGIVILSGWLGQTYGWRAIFIVPAVIALITTAFLLDRLRDTPESLGLPPVEEYYAAVHGGEVPEEIELSNERPSESFLTVLTQKVFSNPYIWFLCIANFFVYTIRYGFFNWAITYLNEVKHIPLQNAGFMTASFEISGMFGALLSGWLADKALGGRRTPICLIYMLGAALSIYTFAHSPMNSPGLDTLSLSLVGFFIYGPQFLIAVMVTDLASKEAAASAIGLTGFFGYGSGVIYGYGLGYLVEHYGWPPTFQVLLGCCFAALIPFSLCWKKT